MAERSSSASDEAILAALDAAPAAFAAFYRRRAGRLLSDFAQRTNNPRLAAELCAETFAAALASAHRFDPARGSAAAWLDAIAETELAHAERSGTARDRARRQLGLAALEPGERFIADLEEELVEAARFLARRRAAPAVAAAAAALGRRGRRGARARRDRRRGRRRRRQ